MEPLTEAAAELLKSYSLTPEQSAGLEHTLPNWQLLERNRYAAITFFSR
jgi:hypothetical protein